MIMRRVMMRREIKIMITNKEEMKNDVDYSGNDNMRTRNDDDMIHKVFESLRNTSNADKRNYP